MNKYMCRKLWSRETLRFKGNKTNSFSKGEVIKFFVIYPIQKVAACVSNFIIIIIYSSKGPLGTTSPWGQGLLLVQ